MFNKGDSVVHPRYGAGIVNGIEEIERYGEKKRYLCIELNDENGGRLMIPEDRVEDSDLRDALTDFAQVETIMFSQPEELPDNHRSRQARLESVLKKGRARKLIQALRDLYWKEWTTKLTSTDSRLRNKILHSVITELAAAPSVTLHSARQRIITIADTAMREHETSLEAQSAQT